MGKNDGDGRMQRNNTHTHPRHLTYRHIDTGTQGQMDTKTDAQKNKTDTKDTGIKINTKSFLKENYETNRKKTLTCC